LLTKNVDFFFFFFFGNKLYIRNEETKQASRGKENSRSIETITGEGGKEKEGKKMGMQPKKPLTVAQYATWRMQKLAFLLIFLASQEKEAGKMEREFAITFSKCQSWVMAGNCRAEITI
jgi:hypothetical protein